MWNITVNHAGTCIAAACEDGTIRLFNVVDGALSYTTSMAGHQGTIFLRILALDGRFHAPKPDVICMLDS